MRAGGVVSAGAARLLGAAVLVAAALAGCSHDSEEPRPQPPHATSTPTPTTAQQQVIVALLATDDAQPTMSDAQREALLVILATGTVTFEQYRDAVNLTLECAQDAGLVIDGPQTVERGGQPVLDWGWADPAQPNGNPALGEHCQRVHSFGIEQAYLNSDVALEDERRQLEEYRAQIVACYSDGGAPLDDPATDIFDLLNQIPELAGERADAVDQCIFELDIMVW